MANYSLQDLYRMRDNLERIQQAHGRLTDQQFQDYEHICRTIEGYEYEMNRGYNRGGYNYQQGYQQQSYGRPYQSSNMGYSNNYSFNRVGGFNDRQPYRVNHDTNDFVTDRYVSKSNTTERNSMFNTEPSRPTVTNQHLAVGNRPVSKEVVPTDDPYTLDTIKKITKSDTDLDKITTMDNIGCTELEIPYLESIKNLDKVKENIIEYLRLKNVSKETITLEQVLNLVQQLRKSMGVTNIQGYTIEEVNDMAIVLDRITIPYRQILQSICSVIPKLSLAVLDLTNTKLLDALQNSNKEFVSDVLFKVIDNLDVDFQTAFNKFLVTKAEDQQNDKSMYIFNIKQIRQEDIMKSSIDDDGLKLNLSLNTPVFFIPAVEDNRTTEQYNTCLNFFKNTKRDTLSYLKTKTHYGTTLSYIVKVNGGVLVIKG